MITRSIFKFTKLVKYNILMLFALLMIQGLVVAIGMLFSTVKFVTVLENGY